MEQVMEKPKCKLCGSAHIYRRILTDEIVCQKCGHIEKLKGEEKNS